MSRPGSCERCGRENEPGFSFCLDCGGPLRPATPPAGGAPEARCTACGTHLQPGFKFCGHCGTPVAGQGHPPTPAAPAPPAPRPRAAAPQGPLRLTTVRHDGLPGAVHRLEREETTCGRVEGEIRLPEDPTVSPRHARFVRRGPLLEVEDLGSAGGTFLRLRAPRALQVGDELRVGRQVLRLEPLPRPPEPEIRGVRPWGSRDVGASLRLVQLLDGGGTGEAFPLPPGEHALGREAGQVTFPTDRYVSARHACLDVGAGGVTITDLGSSNGTFLRLAGPAPLAPGDQLLIGTQLLQLDA